jgi:hypothetical protein
VRLIGVEVAHRPWLAVLEFMQYGDLQHVLKALREKERMLNLSEFLLLARQICEGLEYVHSRVSLNDFAIKKAWVSIHRIFRFILTLSHTHSLFLSLSFSVSLRGTCTWMWLVATFFSTQEM